MTEALRRHTARFRFYAELNDFLPDRYDGREIPYAFRDHPSVKDAIEALGVPHTEVELILVDGRAVGFDYHLRDGDRVAVYPAFESWDVSSLVQLRERPLRRVAFILDVHLGKLARLLRLLGFDALYRNDYEDHEIVAIARAEHRIILTRDRGILKYRDVTHGYWVRSTDPIEQAREVLRRFDLAAQVAPFRRCLVCNGLIEPVDKADVLAQLPPATAMYYDEFYKCADCGKVYWRGAHYARMLEKVAACVQGGPTGIGRPSVGVDEEEGEGDEQPGEVVGGSDSG